MSSLIDRLLNKITMYRLVLYYLIILEIIAFILSLFGYFQFSAIDLVISTVIIVSFSLLSNKILGSLFKVDTNHESVYITALILVLIVAPGHTSNSILLLGVVAILAMASKYLLVYKKSHIFNPVTIAVVISALAFSQYASWWVGTTLMVPFVLIGGLLIVHKMQRQHEILVFSITAFVLLVFNYIWQGSNITVLATGLKLALIQSSFLFFTFAMFTEPLTSPTTKGKQTWFAMFVAFLYVSPQLKPFGVSLTPEYALVFGNALSFIYSPQYKLFLPLRKTVELAHDTYAFIFDRPAKFAYEPGQFMEWTLSHKNPDNRGNRRYFSILTSPEEDILAIAVKFYTPPSSYKKVLLNLEPDNEIIASELGGDFTLPKNKSLKLCFIAGGIGIAPFRSMIKHMIETGDEIPVTLLYSNKTIYDIAFRELFEEAEKSIGLKMFYALSDIKSIPPGWPGLSGIIDNKTILKTTPDYMERVFYISGPPSMVNALRTTLKKMGVNGKNIKADYFPGYE